MASCSLATLQAQACANGFLGLDDKQAKALILVGFGSISGNELDAEELYSQAKVSGLCGMTDKQFGAAILQSMCNLGEGLLPECENLIPDSVLYPLSQVYFVSPLLIVGTTYIFTWGINETNIKIGAAPPIDNPGVGQSFQFTHNGDQFVLFGIGHFGEPITATLCEV